MKIRQWPVYAVLLCGCVSTGNSTQEPKPAEPVTSAAAFELAKNTSGQGIAQTLSPDSHALAVLFDSLQASTETNALGVAQLSESLSIPIKGSGVVRVSIDARGSTVVNEGDCELSMSLQSGGARHWSSGEGSYALNLSVDVRAPFTLKVAVHGVCYASAAEGSAALLTVDSLDLTLEPRPAQTEQKAK